MARQLKVCELDSLPVLSYLNKITDLRRMQHRETSVFEPMPYVCLGYTSVLLMTSKDVYAAHRRNKPFFHIVSTTLLSQICPDLHKIIFQTYRESDPEWKPYINESMRSRDFVLVPKADTFTDLADTARIVCLVNTGGDLVFCNAYFLFRSMVTHSFQCWRLLYVIARAILNG